MREVLGWMGLEGVQVEIVVRELEDVQGDWLVYGRLFDSLY